MTSITTKFLIESMTRHGSFHSTLIDTSKSTVGRRMFFLSYIIPSLLQRLLQITIDPDITRQLQPSFSILQHPTVSVHTNNMKTEAQTQLYCEGRRHCIGCAKRVETWFSLRCQACWEKQAAASRDIFFKPVDYSVIPDPSKKSKVPAKTEPSGRCMTCTASTYGPALFCQDCEPHYNTNN